jgi:hypothetical protein
MHIYVYIDMQAIISIIASLLHLYTLVYAALSAWNALPQLIHSSQLKYHLSVKSLSLSSPWPASILEQSWVLLLLWAIFINMSVIEIFMFYYNTLFW